MGNDLLCGLLALSLLGAGAAAAQQPMSAIDWLSESVATPAPLPPPPEPEVAPDALPSEVTVTVLGQPTPDATGVLPPAVSGLPRDLWGLGRRDEIAAAVAGARADALPATRALLITLLLAETEPPADSRGDGRLLLARVDKLLELGALEEAAALIEAAGRGSGAPAAELFRRSVDVAMLTGTEDSACAAMRAAPNLAPTFPARIFCLARAGDWNAAALTLRTAQALGHVGPAEDAILSRFLDPDLYEGDAPPELPSPMTPLVWRLLEAIGEGTPTSGLPLAFAHADLRDNAGWRAQIEAAERLARGGVLDPNALLGIYAARLPAASGGVWDRVEAFQRIEMAVNAGDPGAVAASLPRAWAQMAAGELEVPFAALFAERLIRLELPPDARALAFRVLLLSPLAEKAALGHSPADETEAFLAGLARGDLGGIRAPDSLARAIAPAFTDPDPGEELSALLAEDRLGEAVLGAIERIERGVTGDLRGVTEGLSLLRQAGLESAARRAALELMILERRG